MEMVVLTCECGRKIKAPGAKPGRVGRCPACGAMLSVPEPTGDKPSFDRSFEDAVDEALIGSRKSDAPLAVGAYDLNQPARTSSAPKPRRQRRDDETHTPVDAKTPDVRIRLIRPPARPAHALSRSLGYPLWDESGLGLILFLTPLLGITSILSFGMIPFANSGDDYRWFGTWFLIAPMFLVFLYIAGYVAQYMNEVVVSGFHGEVYHPKLPPWGPAGPVVALGTWLVAALPGLAVCGALAYAYNGGVPDFESLQASDWAVLGVILAPGLAYAQVALLGALAFSDIRTVNPLAVLAAMGRIGFGLVRAWLFLAVAITGVVLVGVGLFRIPNILASIPAAFLAWAGMLYLGQALAHDLGSLGHARSKTLGWFPKRARWGASTGIVKPDSEDEPEPEPRPRKPGPKPTPPPIEIQ